MYTPQLPPDQIQCLYLLKCKTGKPMTKLLREAVKSYLKRNRVSLAETKQFCQSESQQSTEFPIAHIENLPEGKFNGHIIQCSTKEHYTVSPHSTSPTDISQNSEQCTTGK